MAFACSFLALESVCAQEKTLTVGMYGGSWETVFKEKIIPVFETANKVKVEVVPGNSTENLARLQAQKGNQELDVVILDDGPMYQAVALGFCAPLAKAPIYDEVYDLAKFSPNAVGVSVAATGYTINTEWFKKEGWDEPSSWADLQDPKYNQVLVIPPINNTYGLHALVMTARLNGGDEKNIDVGFSVMKEKIAPQVLVFEPSAGKMSELFQSNDIAIAIWGSGRAYPLAQTGFPAKFVYPKEGAVVLMVTACPVVGSDVPELADAFIQHMLSKDVQELLAIEQAYGPANKTVKLPEEIAANIPYGDDKIGKMQKMDWDTINPLREEWTKRWAREIER
ncbi:MAG: ABC transporter substrate-binding protein [Methylobacteriaceae bacterium]|jgi:putative spermidine/putrescine transport system substrate-binding protein|nr:ABC transporter substrate-binding protein [Methylobacteriaceae bacterium]